MNDSVLFLDIDGVLNRCGQSGQGLESDKVSLLKGILDETGARVILASTWRKSERNLDRIKIMLRDIGHELHGVTPILDSREPGRVVWSSPKRGDEICVWLGKNHETTNFVILDDDLDAGYGPNLLESFIQTDSFVGLTQEISNRVIAKFNQ